MNRHQVRCDLRANVEAELKWEPSINANEIGVRGVSNLLAVKVRLVPLDVKQKIEEALVRSAHTDANRITVDVDGTKITLTGTVRAYGERQDAGRSAWAAPGVTAVDNRPTIAVS